MLTLGFRPLAIPYIEPPKDKNDSDMAGTDSCLGILWSPWRMTLMVTGHRRHVEHHAYGCGKFAGVSSRAPRPHADIGFL